MHPLKTKTQILPGFSEVQSRIILDRSPVIQVVAAAGSGKTRTVIGIVEHTLQNGYARKGKILLLSFSKKAVGEIKERIREEFRSCVNVSTFHSFCFRMIRRFHPHYSQNDFSILDDEMKDAFLVEFLKNTPDETGGIPYSMILSNLERASRVFPGLVAGMRSALQKYKTENGFVEYDDLIEILLDAMKGREAWCIPVFNMFDLLIVDEFQDTDPDQLEFLRILSPPSLVVVGDDWQAIYGFRGATVEPFLRFPRIFRGTRVHRLSENFRSRKEIIEAGGLVINETKRRLRKRVKAARGKGGKFTVFSTPFFPGSEGKFTGELLKKETDWRILVRTNERVRNWINAGIPEDRVLTIHKSKGLEFPTILLDLSEGWSSGKDGELPDEELRIVYVGMTRAMDRLILLRRVIEDEGFEHLLWEKALSGRFPEKRIQETLALI